MSNVIAFSLSTKKKKESGTRTTYRIGANACKEGSAVSNSRDDMFEF